MLILVDRVEFESGAASALDLVVFAGNILVLADYLAVAVVAECMAVAVAGYKELVAELQTLYDAEQSRW